MPFHPKPSRLRFSCPNRNPNYASCVLFHMRGIHAAFGLWKEVRQSGDVAPRFEASQLDEALRLQPIGPNVLLPPCTANCHTRGSSSHYRDSVPHICSKTSIALIHTSSRNRFVPRGVNCISGGLPSGQGTSPFFLIQAPMAGLRSSGHVVQNVFVIFTGIVSLSISIRMTLQFLSKDRSAFSRPTLTPRATARPATNFPLFQPETSTPDLHRTYPSATTSIFSSSASSPRLPTFLFFTPALARAYHFCTSPQRSDRKVPCLFTHLQRDILSQVASSAKKNTYLPIRS